MLADPNLKIGVHVGEGAFGKVFSAKNAKTLEEVAIKLEQVNKIPAHQMPEAEIYKIIHNADNESAEGIPYIVQSKVDETYSMIVMELLGPSLESIFKQRSLRFSLKTVLMIAVQLMTRIERIHKAGILHRDLKPENLLIGRGKNQDIVYTVDFGLAKQYIEEGEHIKCKIGKKLAGTVMYVSQNTHKGIEQSRRDDLESIGYILIYFLKGALPWSGLKGDNRQEKFDNIKNKKSETSIETLCEGLPAEFAEYMTYVKNLKFADEPDYNKLKGLFLGLLDREGYKNDCEFDWMIKEKKRSRPTPPTSFDSHADFSENIDSALDGSDVQDEKTKPVKYLRKPTTSTSKLITKAPEKPKPTSCFGMFNCFF